jgi:membrane protease YdiL (CAAX protease family)
MQVQEEQEAAEISPQKRREILLEMIAVVLAFVLPFLYSAVRLFLRPGSAPKYGFIEHSLLSLLGMVSMMPIILYVVWKSGEGFERFGLRAWRWGVDTATAVIVFLLWMGTALPQLAFLQYTPSFYAYSLRIMELNRTSPPVGVWEIVMLAVLQIANAFREEFVLRGYLITRCEDMRWPALVTVLVPALLFSSYHIYEGPVATVAILLCGIFNGIAYKLCRSIWPLVVLHALWNMRAVLYF